jgi:type IV pilus assembly protein PilV
MQKPHHGQRTQRGTSMIEVLVAFLVLSFGLVGLTALQTRAITSSSSATAQATMVQILGSYAETRRATPNLLEVEGGVCYSGSGADVIEAIKSEVPTWLASCNIADPLRIAMDMCDKQAITTWKLTCTEEKSRESITLWYSSLEL